LNSLTLSIEVELYELAKYKPFDHEDDLSNLLGKCLELREQKYGRLIAHLLCTYLAENVESGREMTDELAMHM
jgi:hypothetical protein